ncbi:MAG: pyruvate kinase, partial [Oscillospiraceae bacterium]|nr:pyruvate kinase [Oscillospiraceae bacterium]
MNRRKTKIICTLGPAVNTPEKLRALIRSGMNGARFNFSHGTHESQLEMLNMLKSVRDSLGSPVATILDTKGPEIRIKAFREGKIELKNGDAFTLTARDVEGDSTIVSVTYDKLYEEVKPGTTILVDDGLIGLEVREISGQDIHCTVVSGGPLSNNKSINIPGTSIHLPALTYKDEPDIKFGVENDFDYLAASFVRKAEDVRAIREVLHRYGGDNVRIISKIENQEGVDNLEEILDEYDGIMVARGVLGVEIPAPQVPVEQKRMIKAAQRKGKLVVIATQMLDSMMRNPRPTRAEVSDVANAVF